MNPIAVSVIAIETIKQKIRIHLFFPNFFIFTFSLVVSTFTLICLFARRAGADAVREKLQRDVPFCFPVQTTAPQIYAPCRYSAAAIAAARRTLL